MKLLNEDERKELEKISGTSEENCYSKEDIYINPVTLDASVIIPCYNVERYLEKCINSIVKQKNKYNYEIILIDDGSEDDTLKIIQKYAAEYSNIVVINDGKQGVAEARNKGVKISRGKYLIFIDADDYVDDKYIEVLLKNAISQDIDIVACKYITFNEKKILDIRNPKNVRDENFINGCFWGKAFKRELFGHILEPKGYWYEDTILTHIIYPNAKTFYITDECYYAYRHNSKGIMSTSKKSNKAIDSILVSDLILSEIEKTTPKEYFKSQKCFEKIALQFFINENRIKNLEKKYKRISFLAQSRYINENYSNYKIENNLILKLYIESLRKKRYFKSQMYIYMEKLCRFLSYIK